MQEQVVAALRPSSGMGKRLRLTPGIVLVTVQLLLTYGVPALVPDSELFGMPLGMLGLFGGLLAFVGLLSWWLFFSRAQWSERIGVLPSVGAALVLGAIAFRLALKPR